MVHLQPHGFQPAHHPDTTSSFHIYGLDAITSDILIQDLALIQPFTQITVRKCFENEDVIQLYKGPVVHQLQHEIHRGQPLLSHGQT
jgi:hypothetical protein